MWGSVVGFLKELFGLGRAGIEFQTKKLEEKNTEQMKQAAEAQREAADVDQTRKAIATKNLDELRKEISE